MRTVVTSGTSGSDDPRERSADGAEPEVVRNLPEVDLDFPAAAAARRTTRGPSSGSLARPGQPRKTQEPATVSGSVLRARCRRSR